jgi:hypothetical protein
MTPVRTLPALLAGFVLSSAVPATAQIPGIQPGETVSARLEATDRTLGDGSHYKLFLYRGEPGEEVVVTLRSVDFDTFVSVGHMDDTTFVAADSDDDSGGGTDARLRTVVGPSGTLVIQANSYESGATGAFTLEVEVLPGVTMVRRIIERGATVTAQFVPTDPVRDDGSLYHIYVYRGTPGQQIVVTMRSMVVDAYLEGGRLEGGTFVVETSDDDSGGDTDAMMNATVGPSGEYVIRATTYGSSATGEYTLAVEVPGR